MKLSGKYLAGILLGLMLIESLLLGNGPTLPQAGAVCNTITKIAAGGNSTFAIKSDGTVWGWGYNTQGQLGDGTQTSHTAQVQVASGLSGVTAIAAGNYHTAALKSDGTVWVWGKNDYGQLGDGSTTERYTDLVQVSGLSGVTAIAAGSQHTAALKSDGTVWGWGYNGYGQLGDGSEVTPDEYSTTGSKSTTPVQASGLTGVTAIAAGGDHTAVLKSDGTVWSWGENSQGQLGNGTTTTYSLTPVQASGLTDVAAIAASSANTVALKNDGTVWAWGYNNMGQLGDGSTTNRTAPVQTSGLTGVTAVAAGFAYMVALKNDGTVWTWGYNELGQLGDGSTTNRTAPVKILLASPAPAADTSDNNVDHELEISFAADADYEAVITGVSFKGTALTLNTDYAVTSGKITLKPGGGNPALTTAATGDVIITAAGYADSVISQTINAGTAAALTVSTQPAAGASSGAAFATQPTVSVKDQYGNVCSTGLSAAANVVAAATGDTWTIGGTTTQAASAGIATFGDLTCARIAANTGSITFSCGTLTVNSNVFNIPGTESKVLATDTSDNDVDHDIEISFASDAVFAAAVYSVSFNGTVLTAGTDYVVGSQAITLKPGGGNTVLITPATGTVVVKAAGYSDSAVSQTINPGAAASMTLSTDIKAPACNGGQFAVQPVITLKDAYGNICTTDNSTQVTASKKDAGDWTVTGTTTTAAVYGVAAFTDLGAANTAKVDSAQLAFTVTGLAEVTSSAVTLAPSSGWTFADGNGAGGVNQNTARTAQVPKLAGYNSDLYAAWQETNGTATQIRVKKYDGTSWAFADGGGTTGLNKDSARTAASVSLAVYDNNLYAAWQETNGTATQIRVKKYDGTSWTFADGDGATGLNKNSAKAAAGVSLAVYDNALYAAWQETNGTATQIRVKKYDGTSWTFVDGDGTNGLNKDSGKAAAGVSLAVFNNSLYAAWQENNGTSRVPITQIRVKKYDGTSWTFADGDDTTGLNKNTAYNALYPSLAVYNNALYGAWQENNGTATQIRVKKYNGTAWTFADGDGTDGLNKDSGKAAAGASLAVYNNTLYAAWQENNGTATQIRAKKYDGASWAFADGDSTTGLNKDSGKAVASACLAVYANALYAAWQENNGTADQIRLAQYKQTGSTSSDATLSSLSLSEGTLNPVFSPTATSYTASVANSVSSLTVTPIVNESHATIKVNEQAVTSGSASAPVSLNEGGNTITVVVTAQNTSTTRTYTLVVNRAASPPPYVPTVWPAYSAVVAVNGIPGDGAAFTVTLTVNNSDGTVDTTFTGSRAVTISGYGASPSGSYGSFAGQTLSALPQTVNVDFVNGTAQVSLVLYNAASQSVSFSIAGVTIPAAGTVSLTPTPESAVSLQITGQPVLTATDSAIIPVAGPAAQIIDVYGNPVGSSGITATAARKEGSGDWNLTGSLTAVAINGIINFTGLQVENLTTQDINSAVITLGAEGLTPADSQPFTIPAGKAPLQTGSAILSFSLSEQTGPAGIDPDARTVTVEVKSGADVTGLAAIFTLSPGARATVGNTIQESGVSLNDYSQPLSYTIQAEDGSISVWTVTVSQAIISGTKEILSFSLPEQTGSATISSGSGTIDIEVTENTDLSGLIASFEISGRASITVNGIEQQSDITINDFTNPLEYTVTAEDGSQKTWTVTVSVKTSAPSVSLDNIFSNSVLTTGYPLISGKTNKAGLTIEIYIDGQLNGTAASNYYKEYSYTPSVQLSDGRHSLRIVVKDGSLSAATEERTFVVATSSGTRINMTTNPGSIIGDGKSQVMVEALLQTGDGAPIPGVAIDFKVSAGTLSASQAVTGTDGKAAVVMTAPRLSGIVPRQEVITARVSKDELMLENNISIQFQPACIQGVVTDNSKEGHPPVAGATVELKEDLDGNGVIDFTASVTTGADGRYTIYVPEGNHTYTPIITIPVQVGNQTVNMQVSQKTEVGSLSGVGETITAGQNISGKLMLGEEDGNNLQEIQAVFAGNSVSASLLTGSGEVAQSAIQIGQDGSFNIENVEPGEYTIRFDITAPGGEQLASQVAHVTVSQEGEMTVIVTLIDPYGIVTDEATSQPAAGVTMKLYWADTSVNSSAGRTPDTLVNLPELPNFAPNRNLVPQETSSEGKYAWMVFPQGDYYILAEKDGYETYDSRIEKRTAAAKEGEDSWIEDGIIHVGQTIVNYDLTIRPQGYQPPTPGEEAPQLSAVVKAGSATGATSITAAPSTGNHLLVVVSAGAIATPNTGDAAPAGSGVIDPYVSGSDISGVDATTNKYVGIYEIDENGQVFKFSLITLSSSDIVGSGTGGGGGSHGGGGSSGGSSGGGSSAGGGNASTSGAIEGGTIATTSIPDTDKPVFNDLTGHWAKEIIEKMAERKIVSGAGNERFEPDNAISRAEVASLLDRALNIPLTSAAAITFNDTQGDWYTYIIEAANRHQLMKGYGDKTFKPENTITRQEMAMVISNVLNYQKHNTVRDDSEVNRLLEAFSDRDNIAGWAREAVAAAVQAGIITGYDSYFNPDRSCTRAEAAVMLYQTIE